MFEHSSNTLKDYGYWDIIPSPSLAVWELGYERKVTISLGWLGLEVSLSYIFQFDE